MKEGERVDKSNLVIEIIGKTYSPDSSKLIVYQGKRDPGGSTSVRNEDESNLEWKKQGYFQRNRDVGQVFTAIKEFDLQAIVLRTGPSDKAVLEGAPGAEVFIQFFEVTGAPHINDNNTPLGVDAKHGFSKNHRCDDFIEGVDYKPIQVIKGGFIPALPVSFKNNVPVNGDAGRLVYMRWKFPRSVHFEAGKRYAFMVGFVEPGKDAGFTLANHNSANKNVPPALSDQFDAYSGGWSVRREGNGALPPAMAPDGKQPNTPALLKKFVAESLFPKGYNRFSLAPTTDGYPDVDTYRDLEFALEQAEDLY